MKVYELIQELTQFKPDTEVIFHVRARFDTDVEAEFNRESEDDTQEVTVPINFDEDVDFYDIKNHEGNMFHPDVTINFEY